MINFHSTSLHILRALALTLGVLLIGASSSAQVSWTAKLDGDARFYQTTDLGVLVIGTEKSLYALDAATGDVMWRRKARGLDETDVAAVPGTDLLLVAIADGERSRLEAVDLLGGGTVWRTDAQRGGVMGMAVDTDARLLAVTLVRDARGRAREGFRRRARTHVFDLATGRALWKRETSGDIEMMPVCWADDGDVPYTLDNYRPPLFLDNRLWLFYEGVTSFDAHTGENREREKFSVNEDGFALTEADPIADDEHLYTSGRGRVRAISRRTGAEVWRADDLGRTPEMTLANDLLIVRTGGRFLRLADGEAVARGPYGISAIDRRTGKTVWRFKGADKGLTNFVVTGNDTILVADRDDLITLELATGKRIGKVVHKIDGAAFVITNESGAAVVGGRAEVAAFEFNRGVELWRARHTAPSRGVLRTVGAIAARAGALYFRYGGAATAAVRGVGLARAASSLRWSGLAARLSVSDLTTLAANRAREGVTSQLTTFGLANRLAARTRDIASSVRGTGAPNLSNLPRPSVDVEERLLDRLDPARQLERLSRFLLRRERLAALRGDFMYFYTNLTRADDGERGRGLAGVNVHTGRTERAFRVEQLDARFLVDENSRLLFTANDNRIIAYRVGGD